MVDIILCTRQNKTKCSHAIATQNLPVPSSLTQCLEWTTSIQGCKRSISSWTGGLRSSQAFKEKALSGWKRLRFKGLIAFCCDSCLAYTTEIAAASLVGFIQRSVSTETSAPLEHVRKCSLKMFHMDPWEAQRAGGIYDQQVCTPNKSRVPRHGGRCWGHCSTTMTILLCLTCPSP